jgi:hypothetical protein
MRRGKHPDWSGTVAQAAVTTMRKLTRHRLCTRNGLRRIVG